MTRNEVKPSVAAVQELFAQRSGGLRENVRAVMQEMLEAEMTDALGAQSERTAGRVGYRSTPRPFAWPQISGARWPIPLYLSCSDTNLSSMTTPIK